MYDSHIVWGDGTGFYLQEKISQYSKRSMETVPELFKKGDDELIKLKTQQIYFINDCIVFHMSTGEVFQKGVFSFQKQNNTYINSQDVIQIDLPEKITKIKLGDNHLIFLSKEGNLFTMGDNYYGQLGIDNNMIPKKTEPALISLPDESKCVDIHAYKNTSFAINTNHQLYIWGKSEFIPTHIGNTYAPLHFFRFLKVRSIKHDSDRMIIDATVIEQTNYEEKRKKESDVDDEENEHLEEVEEEEEIDEKEEEDTIIQAQKPTIKRQSSQIIVDHFNKGRKKSSKSSRYSSKSLKKLTEEERERNKYNQIKILLKNLKLFNEKFDIMMKSLADEDKQIEIIRDIVSNQSKYTFKDNRSLILFKIEDMFDKLFTNWTRQQPRKEEDYLTSFFLILMTQMYNNTKENKYETMLKQVTFQADKFSKDYKTFLAKNQLEFFLQKNSNKEEKYEKAIIKEFYGLLPFLLSYKKVDALIHRLSLNQTFLFSYEMNNVRNALEEEMKQSNHSIGKLKLIQNKFGFIESLLSLFNINFKELDVLYNSLPQRFSIQNPQGSLALQSEQYIYKTLIQSTMYISDLWEMLIEKINSETTRREKLKEITKTVNRFKDIYCTQIYLEKLDFPFPFKKELNQSIKKNMVESIAQVDGCVFHIQKIISETINTEKVSEIENRKILIMYASSVLETAKLQRMIWFVLFEQIKAGII